MVYPRPRATRAVGYFGTLKIAIRVAPTLMVSISLATNTRFLPLVVAKRHPVPLVIRSHFFRLRTPNDDIACHIFLPLRVEVHVKTICSSMGNAKWCHAQRPAA